MNQENPIRILLVDDHEMVRKGLAVFIESYADLALVGEAEDGKEALQACEEHSPDVILMDILMPVMDGIEATKAILELYPHIKVIAMTSFEEETLVKDIIKNGAIGFLLKNTSIEDLAMAIRNAVAGIPTLAPEATQILMSATSRKPDPEYDLTARELEVLFEMVEGGTNPAIAERLSISRSTVKTHVSNILAKLKVSSRVEAVKLALENDLV